MKATGWAMAAALIAVFSVTFFTCTPKVRTSAATANNAPHAETETVAPYYGKSSGEAKIKYVAVVETEVDAQSGASAGLNPAEVRQITAALRREAVENLPRGTYNIMTSETVQSMGGAVLEECAEENCVITLGSRIGADYIVRGIISKYGTKFTLSVEMYETDNGTLVASSEYVRADNAVELMDKAVVASANMYRKFVNPQGFAPKQQEQQAVAYSAPVAPSPPQQTAVVATQPASATPRLPQPAQPASPPPAQPPPIYQTPAPMPTPTPTYQTSVVDGSGTFTDSRDGKKYKTVVIGGNRWMARNLNYQTLSGSWCYDNDNSNCDKYGRLYDWNTAMTICPAGYHLPSLQEWNNLVAAAGGQNVAGKKLKARSSWSNNGNGTDDFSFSALPGGYRGSSGTFDFAGNNGFWWTAAEYSSGYPYCRVMYYINESVNESHNNKGGGYSVRCLQD